MRITLPLVLVLFFFSACGTSMPSGATDSDVRLEASPDDVSTGGSVTLTLTNHAPEPIGYNLCSSGLEARDGADWTAVQSSRVCTMELRVLDPGQATRYTFDLPGDLEPGEYRFSTTIERLDGGERDAVRSGPFTVREP